MNAVKSFIHQMRLKAVASVVLLVLASFQVFPASWAGSVPISSEVQSQVPTQAVGSEVSSENIQPAPQTSIDFLTRSKSPLSAPELIALPANPVEGIEPIVVPSSPVPNPLEVPVNKPSIDLSFLQEVQDDPLSIGGSIRIEFPKPDQELILIADLLKRDRPSLGNTAAYFTVIKEEIKAPESPVSQSAISPRKQLAQYLIKKRFRPLDRKKADQISPQDEQNKSIGSNPLRHGVIRHLRQSKNSVKNPIFRLHQINQGRVK